MYQYCYIKECEHCDKQNSELQSKLDIESKLRVVEERCKELENKIKDITNPKFTREIEEYPDSPVIYLLEDPCDSYHRLKYGRTNNFKNRAYDYYENFKYVAPKVHFYKQMTKRETENIESILHKVFQSYRDPPRSEWLKDISIDEAICKINSTINLYTLNNKNSSKEKSDTTLDDKKVLSRLKSLSKEELSNLKNEKELIKFVIYLLNNNNNNISYNYDKKKNNFYFKGPGYRNTEKDPDTIYGVLCIIINAFEKYLIKEGFQSLGEDQLVNILKCIRHTRDNYIEYRPIIIRCLLYLDI